MTSEREQWLYFIVNETRTHVKIGKSSSKKGCMSRLSGLQCGNPFPLYIAALMAPWTHHGEKSVHRLFQEFRGSGEWFTLDDSIWAFMERHAQRPARNDYEVTTCGTVTSLSGIKGEWSGTRIAALMGQSND